MNSFVKDKKSAIIAFSLLAVVIIGNTIYRNYYLDEKQTSYAPAIITKSYINYKTSLYFDFEFYFNNQKYKGSKEFSNIGLDDSKKFIGKWFPVAFSKNKPDVNKLLMDKYDFEKFNLTYPDSLAWAVKYYN